MGWIRRFKVPRTGEVCTYDTAKMAGQDFRGGNLEGCDLHDLDMHGACFEGANLRGANLRGANLESANLRYACLDNADLSEANLRGTQLWQTNLWRAKTRRTDMRGARNLACTTGTAYNAQIFSPQLRVAINDMNYSVWQQIWRFERATLWSLVAVALATGGRFSHRMSPPWDRWVVVASMALLGTSLLGLVRAHYIRRFKTSYWQD